MKRGMKFSLVSLACALIAVVVPGPVQAQSGSGEGLKPVALVEYPSGSHVALATIKGRDYAFAAEQGSTGKLRVIDVTNPERPIVKAEILCGSGQGNIQLSPDKKTLLLGLDSGESMGVCPSRGQPGFATIDISKPTVPRPVGFAVNLRGSHSLAVHPTKPIVYNGSGFPEPRGEMEIWSIKDPAKPKLMNTVPTGAHSPHDLSFNRTGTMAATANVVSFQLWDTRNPVEPKLLSEAQCPGCQHTHEARFTPNGKRLVVNDEMIAGGGVYACPGGALYFYDVAEDGSSVALTGVYSISEVGVNAALAPGFCTPHVFDISDDGTKVAAAWHSGGIRYLDISKASGATVGEGSTGADGVKELGWYLPPGGDSFTAQFHKGPYIYAVDSNRGLEVLKILGGS